MFCAPVQPELHINVVSSRRTVLAQYLPLQWRAELHLGPRDKHPVARNCIEPGRRTTSFGGWISSANGAPCVPVIGNIALRCEFIRTSARFANVTLIFNQPILDPEFSVLITMPDQPINQLLPFCLTGGDDDLVVDLRVEHRGFERQVHDRFCAGFEDWFDCFV